MVMFCLMNNDDMGTNNPRAPPTYKADYHDKHIYHPDLERLAFQCLAPKPDDRPQINGILWRTRKGLAGWQNVYEDVSGPDVPPRYSVRVDEEHFAVGSTVPEN
jgi:hypothetical protein